MNMHKNKINILKLLDHENIVKIVDEYIDEEKEHCDDPTIFRWWNS